MSFWTEILSCRRHFGRRSVPVVLGGDPFVILDRDAVLSFWTEILSCLSFWTGIRCCRFAGKEILSCRFGRIYCLVVLDGRKGDGEGVRGVVRVGGGVSRLTQDITIRTRALLQKHLFMAHICDANALGLPPPQSLLPPSHPSPILNGCSVGTSHSKNGTD